MKSATANNGNKESDSGMLTHSCPYNPNCHHSFPHAQIDYVPKSPISTKEALKN